MGIASKDHTQVSEIFTPCTFCLFFNSNFKFFSLSILPQEPSFTCSCHLLSQAVVKNAEVGQWFSYDDTHVSPVPSPAAAITPHAYVLFYQRQGAPSKWGGLSLPADSSSAPPQSPSSGKSKKPPKR